MTVDLQSRVADARWDLACERVAACRVAIFIRERSLWRNAVDLPLPATTVTIRAVVESALSRAKGLFELEKFNAWDRTPERLLIGVAAYVYAEVADACPAREYKRWISDYVDFEKGLS